MKWTQISELRGLRESAGYRRWRPLGRHCDDHAWDGGNSNIKTQAVFVPPERNTNKGI